MQREKKRLHLVHDGQPLTDRIPAAGQNTQALPLKDSLNKASNQTASRFKCVPGGSLGSGPAVAAGDSRVANNAAVSMAIVPASNVDTADALEDGPTNLSILKVLGILAGPESVYVIDHACQVLP